MLVLFINGRPVDCTPLKRALEATYAAILPKASKPWVFLVRWLFQKWLSTTDVNCWL